MLSEARYLDIEANLFYFKAKYEEILNKRPTEPGLISLEDKHADTSRRYYQCIKKQLKDADSKLKMLSQLKNQ